MRARHHQVNAGSTFKRTECFWQMWVVEQTYYNIRSREICQVRLFLKRLAKLLYIRLLRNP